VKYIAGMAELLGCHARDLPHSNSRSLSSIHRIFNIFNDEYSEFKNIVLDVAQEMGFTAEGIESIDLRFEEIRLYIVTKFSAATQLVPAIFLPILLIFSVLIMRL